MSKKKDPALKEYEETMMVLPLKDFIRHVKAEAKEAKKPVAGFLRSLKLPIFGFSTKMHRKIDEALTAMRQPLYMDDLEEIDKLRRQVLRLQRERVRVPQEKTRNKSDERSCCDGEITVTPDGAVKKNGKPCAGFPQQQGKVLYAFASHHGAGFVRYADIHFALHGVNTNPSVHTQGRLRVAVTRTRQVLSRYVEGWDFVAHSKTGWSLERVK